MLAEGLLQRMQAAIGSGEPLDRGDLGAARLNREHSAGLHRFTVHVHRAGAAMAGVATDMRTGDSELLAQQVDQQQARLGEDFDRAVVDSQFDVHFGHRSPPAQPARSLARAMARRTINPATWTRNSTGPCPSAAGLAMRWARRAASAIAASSMLVPTSASPACWANN